MRPKTITGCKYKEKNVRFIFIEKETGIAQPVLQILTPLNKPTKTVVEVAAKATAAYNNKNHSSQIEQEYFTELCRKEMKTDMEQHDEAIARVQQDIPTNTYAVTSNLEFFKHTSKHHQAKKLRSSTHNSHASSTIVCEVCKKEFPNRSRMLWHRRIHDQNRIRYPCPAVDCERVYATKQASYVHYKQSHLDEGLACPVCNKIFIVRQSLEIHMRYHTGEFPYACELCSKRFGQKCHLTTHMQVKHHNLRYYCDEPNCNKMFKNSMSLRNHKFVHSEMPFKCYYCEKGFPQKSKLKAHIIGKHNIDVTFEQLESMKKFQEARTRYTFVKLHKADKQDEHNGSKKET